MAGDRFLFGKRLCVRKYGGVAVRRVASAKGVQDYAVRFPAYEITGVRAAPPVPSGVPGLFNYVTARMATEDEEVIAHFASHVRRNTLTVRSAMLDAV